MLRRNSQTQPTLCIQSYNPYVARFSGRKTISREAVNLMKIFRAAGYRVVVLPDDRRKLEYYTRKGLSEILSDPVVMELIDISKDLAIGIIGSWLYDRMKRKAEPNTEKAYSDLLLKTSESGHEVLYGSDGTPISQDRFKQIIERLGKMRSDYRATTRLRPPNPAFPFQVHLEHSSQVIGWTNLIMDEKGMYMESIQILDESIHDRIAVGELQGASIAGIVAESLCTICHAGYLDCNHIAGDVYDGIQCGCEIVRFDIADISIVNKPVNPECKITIKWDNNERDSNSTVDS